MLLLVIAYPLVLSLLPALSPKSLIALHFAHACAWCIFHCFGLGLLLKAQSKNKFIVRHFLKNYHYSQHDGGKGAIQEAFTNWKSLYNLSLCMTYSTSCSACIIQKFYINQFVSSASFVGLVWKTYSIPNDWTVGNELLRHTLGFVGIYISSINTILLI